ncbi:hypothetical protein ACMFMG_004708 [Clarireedia jacksonii]
MNDIKYLISLSITLSSLSQLPSVHRTHITEPTSQNPHHSNAIPTIYGDDDTNLSTSSAPIHDYPSPYDQLNRTRVSFMKPPLPLGIHLPIPLIHPTCLSSMTANLLERKLILSRTAHP